MDDVIFENSKEFLERTGNCTRSQVMQIVGTGHYDVARFLGTRKKIIITRSLVVFGF